MVSFNGQFFHNSEFRCTVLPLYRTEGDSYNGRPKQPLCDVYPHTGGRYTDTNCTIHPCLVGLGIVTESFNDEICSFVLGTSENADSSFTERDEAVVPHVKEDPEGQSGFRQSFNCGHAE